MAVSFDESQSLMASPFQDRTQCRAALCRVLDSMPNAALYYGRGGENVALFVNPTQFVRLTQDAEGNTLESWPLELLVSASLTCSSNSSVAAGMNAALPLNSEVRKLDLQLEFEGERVVYLHGQDAMPSGPDAVPAETEDVAAFLLHATQVAATHVALRVTWPH